MLLVHSQDDLTSEIEVALSGISDLTVILHEAANYRRGVEEARNRQPDVVCFSMPHDVEKLRAVVAEFGVVSPQSVIIGAISAGVFASGEEESAYLIQALRSHVRDFLRRPISSMELRGCLDRSLGGAPTSSAQSLGRIVSFVSNKGGVGKSTLAVNTACDLAQRSKGSVLLVDAALQLGTCASMLDLAPESTLMDAAAQIERLDEMLLRELVTPHECGLDLLAAPPDAIRAAEIDEEDLSRILAVARRTYDVVVVDTFPVMDAIALAVLDRSDQVFLVASPAVPTVLGLEQLLQLMGRVGVDQDRLTVVLNTSVPRHRGRLTPAEVAERLGRVDYVIPFSRAAMTGMNLGVPAVLNESRLSGFRRALRSLAEDVTGGSPRANGRSDAELIPYWTREREAAEEADPS